MKFRDLALSTVGTAILFAACTGSGATTAPTTAPSVEPTTAPSTQPSMAPSMSPEAMKPTTKSPSADLRYTLASGLGQHALLASLTTHRGLEGGKDFEAAAEALEVNTVALGEAIGSVYGDEAEATFLELWRAHIGFFVDYTVGTASKDDAKKTKAGEDLAGYSRDFAAFLAGATDLPADVLEDELNSHVTHLAGSVDAYAAADYAKAYELTDMAYQHMVATGGTLADAIAAKFPDKFAAMDEATKSAVDLRVALDSALGEHAFLASNATHRGLEGSKAFDAAAGQLETNTVALGDAIGSVFGDEAEATFLELWRAHIGFFVDYTVGTATEDDAKKTKAGEDLAGYSRDFGAFLAGATDLPADVLSAELDSHIKHLAGSIDAYAAGDYAKAYDLMGMGYSHMWATGDVLSEAIVTKMPEKFGQ